MRSLRRIVACIRIGLQASTRGRACLELIEVDGTPRGFALYLRDDAWEAGAAAAESSGAESLSNGRAV